MFYSPLRYPGGKSKLTAYVLEIIKLNTLEGGTYVEPFAGGCAIAWYLLINKHVRKVYINDLDPAIHAFWHSVLYRTDELCSLIDSSIITMDEWHKQREIYRSNTSDFLKLGFATLFLNRTNRSGIIKAGVIGGKEQTGRYKIDCRFNKERVIEQIKSIAAMRDSIRLSNLDATHFIDEVLPVVEDKALINIDPPYYIKGKGLYQNFFEHNDHYRLFESVKRITHPWIVTYDDTPEIRGIYSEFSPEPFGLTYTAQTKYKGAEVIIHSPGIIKANFKPDVSFNEIKRHYRECNK
ncbi:DNA adenine methylase [Yokenella regensburgei]|uniref:site-specific DNA-methyltransferase (adenine-specific) n=1 Tax=Yokenella regensburgei TaxID=158877 RepID=A0AB38FW21_9ENTR|nr:DNA adenine methylase [Yokenella regensburgei]KFD25303.1 DNA-methyltransferase [Yokenella regensburgei ATCC 49455]SQA63340.1 Site-specific DNA methylase [Yokenella regensburgei]SQA68760.1 Site-specific DNA methylase [Yokenella regensburgei]SUQ07075.1 Site-specific DNA methylase [Yokenella regensburgei]